MDLQSEIEARRARLAELRRQRDVHAAGVSTSPVKSQSPSAQVPTDNTKQVTERVSKLTVNCGPLFDIESPILYSKETQSEYSSCLTAPIEEASEEESNPEPVSSTTNEEQNYTIDLIFDSVEPTDANSKEFGGVLHFLDNAWRAVAREHSGANPLKDYNCIPTTAMARRGGAIAEETRFPVAKISKPGHTRTDVTISPIFTDLIATTSGSGVALWSTDAPDTPEYTLVCATVVQCVIFSHRKPGVVFGGGQNGQILRWDLNEGGRLEILPALRSPLDNTGHVDGVIAIANAEGTTDDVLLSLGRDGTVCAWSADMLARPQARFNPSTALNSNSSMISSGLSTCLEGHPVIHGAWIGTFSGNILWTSYEDEHSWPITAHSNPITTLAVRPSRTGKSYDPGQGILFLSSGLDWRLLLWHASLTSDAMAAATAPSPLMEIILDSIIYDIAWCPGNSSVFAAACEAGLQVWDLARSVSAPIHTLSTPQPLFRVEWGTNIVASGPGGCAVYSVPVASQTDGQWDAFTSKVKNNLDVN